jgi:transcriptional regulator with XRE-family HTH domain
LRAGWSREALAHHAGLSWAAIAQIESGRRKEVRLGTLVALAGALGVSVDYLAGNEAMVSRPLLEHRALIYGSDREYLGSAVAFLAEGIARSDCALVVAPRRKIGLVRKALGGDSAHVEFHDSGAWYRSPTGALNDYRTFVGQRFAGGASWIRIFAEPVWAGRTEAEVAMWVRYESMINLALASSPATVVCTYNAASLPDVVLAHARETHPQVAEADATGTSVSYREPADFLLAPP